MSRARNTDAHKFINTISNKNTHTGICMQRLLHGTLKLHDIELNQTLKPCNMPTEKERERVKEWCTGLDK